MNEPYWTRFVPLRRINRCYLHNVLIHLPLLYLLLSAHIGILTIQHPFFMWIETKFQCMPFNLPKCADETSHWSINLLMEIHSKAYVFDVESILFNEFFGELLWYFDVMQMFQLNMNRTVKLKYLQMPFFTLAMHFENTFCLKELIKILEIHLNLFFEVIPMIWCIF